MKLELQENLIPLRVDTNSAYMACKRVTRDTESDSE